MNLTHPTFTLPVLSRTYISQQTARSHSKDAIKSQLINANLNYNNIQLYSVPSIGKVVFTQRRVLFRNTYFKIPDWNENSFQSRCYQTHTHTHTHTHLKGFSIQFKAKIKNKVQMNDHKEVIWCITHDHFSHNIRLLIQLQ
jgi:hypothetical protein